MSAFFSKRFASLTPYTPGEQPRERRYIKLNTNESPFPPSQKALHAAEEAAKSLQLYSDPTARLTTEKLAETLGVSYENVLLSNGSDEILNFAFMAFCDEEHPALFPDITYGFYRVFAQLNRVPYREIPLSDDLAVDLTPYRKAGGTVFLANPNAPTGMALPVSAIESLVASDPTRVVVIDEAYVDFGGESCVPLIRKYPNLLVTGTFSKSRSMAGARLGYGVASPALIQDLNTLKYSTNPYNVNSMTLAAGYGTLCDPDYTLKNCGTVTENRRWCEEQLWALGFETTPSLANFLFVRHPALPGDTLYRKLRDEGILIRRWDIPRIKDYSRITVGSREQMQALVEAVTNILSQQKG